MNWLEELLSRGPVVGDGGMGTMLMAAGLQPGEPSILWNVEHPDRVAAVQRRYADAGAAWLTTNTFGGNPLALARHGLADRTSELNSAAVRIAQRAAAGKARVMGDLGPFGDFLEPYGETSAEELERAVRGQVRALDGVDGFIVETMVDPAELSLTVRVAKESGLPVLATFAFQKSGGTFRTMMGTTVEEAMYAAIYAGADAVGANCGTDFALADYRTLAEEVVRSARGLPAIVQPNAGTPRMAGSQLVYDASPADLASWAVGAIVAGVKIVGGCCGTTPAHIAAISEALRVTS